MTSSVPEQRSSREPARRTATLVVVAIALAGQLLVPAVASAQRGGSGFAGTVTDASGGVLPGVTVEASSPALIEKVRTAVTDSQGRYNIIDLPPGVYSLTFSLTGFGTVKHEGIQLAAAFVATVNAQLPVGSLKEVVVVTGATPVVDISTNARQTSVSSQMLAGIPASGGINYYTTLLLGASQSAQGFTAPTNNYIWADLSFRGVQESSVQLDGFDTSHRMSGNGTEMVLNPAMAQEVAVIRGSAGADQQAGGLVTNVIPRSGGNRFAGSVSFNYAPESFVGNNLNPTLIAQKVGVNSIRTQHDINPAFGGPIAKDKVWFWVSVRSFMYKRDSGDYRDTNPTDWVYTPDSSQSTDSEQIHTKNVSFRVTSQLTPRNQVAVFGDWNPNYWDNRGGCGTTGTRILCAPEATFHGVYVPQYLYGGTWKSPITSKLYVEAGATITKNAQWFKRQDNDPDTGQAVIPDLNAISATDQGTGWTFRGSQWIGNFNNTQGIRVRGSVNRVTGSHSLTLGDLFEVGSDQALRTVPGDYTVNVLNGVPASLVEYGPYSRTARTWSNGLYVTDRFTLKRATFNLGVRYDYKHSSGDPQTLEANSVLPARSFPGADTIWHYHDLSPRIGVSYDLFGTNRTAVKVTVNRYVADAESSQDRVPSVLAVYNTSRSWTDRNGNFLPDCDLTNLYLNNECGTVSNLNFGKVASNITQYDPKVDGGWFNRGYSWEITAAVEHHVTEGIGMRAAYYRRKFGNASFGTGVVGGSATDNLLVTPTDYGHYCVVTPVDPRLPGGGGQQMCGYYDLNPTKLGQVQNYVTKASNFGDWVYKYQGIEASATARMHNGLQFDGGVIIEKITTSNCYVVDNPGQNFCASDPPFRPTFKGMVVYPLPWWGVQVSGVYQRLPGPAYNGTATFTRSQIVGLAWPLSTSTVTLTIVQPNSSFAPYVNKFDMRLSKVFKVGGRHRIMVGLDAFNVGNFAGVLSVNTTVGSNWQYATSIEPARMFRLSGRWDF
jgi:hypothetical protein